MDQATQNDRAAAQQLSVAKITQELLLCCGTSRDLIAEGVHNLSLINQWPRIKSAILYLQEGNETDVDRAKNALIQLAQEIVPREGLWLRVLSESSHVYPHRLVNALDGRYESWRLDEALRLAQSLGLIVHNRRP